jgi:hypothetical protein
MFGKKLSGQKTQKLFMTPAVSSAVAPSARNFQEIQQVIPPHIEAFTFMKPTFLVYSNNDMNFRMTGLEMATQHSVTFAT